MKKNLVTHKDIVQSGDGQKHMQDWMSWVESLVELKMQLGMPVQSSITINASEVKDINSNDPICRMNMIQAEHKNTALKMFQYCIHMNLGSTIELSEAINMPLN